MFHCIFLKPKSALLVVRRYSETFILNYNLLDTVVAQRDVCQA